MRSMPQAQGRLFDYAGLRPALLSGDQDAFVEQKNHAFHVYLVGHDTVLPLQRFPVGLHCDMQSMRAQATKVASHVGLISSS